MNSSSRRPVVRLAVMGALVAVLGLAGCGRKGGLDPPPGAALPGDPALAVAPADGSAALGPDGQPVAPPPPPRPRTFILDGLVD